MFYCLHCLSWGGWSACTAKLHSWWTDHYCLGEVAALPVSVLPSFSPDRFSWPGEPCFKGHSRITGGIDPLDWLPKEMNWSVCGRDCVSCGNKHGILSLSDDSRFIISYNTVTVSVLVSSCYLEGTFCVSYEAPGKNRKYYHILSHNSLFFKKKLWSIILYSIYKLICNNIRKSIFACCTHKGEMFYHPKIGGFCSELSDNKRYIIVLNCSYTLILSWNVFLGIIWKLWIILYMY
jgi:hypothetical protein